MSLYSSFLGKLVFGILRIFVAVYLAILGIVYFWQERLIFFPTALAPDYQFRHSFEEKILEVDGLKVHSLLFKVENSSGLILYFHGNAGSLESWGEVANQLADQTSMNVWIIDYPGYGKSEGKISSEALLHNIASAFMRDAKLMEGSADRIVVYGRSIGTGIAVKLASEVKPRALILESPYFSLRRMASEKFPFVPLFLLRYTLRSDLWIPKVSCPVLFIHGDHDEVIPFIQGKSLSALAQQKSFVAIQGGHHNDLAEFPEYWNSINQFLSGIK